MFNATYLQDLFLNILCICANSRPSPVLKASGDDGYYEMLPVRIVQELALHQSPVHFEKASRYILVIVAQASN